MFSYVGIILVVFWGYSGSIPAIFQDYSGSILGVFLKYSGNIFGLFREYSGSALGKSAGIPSQRANLKKWRAFRRRALKLKIGGHPVTEG